MAGRNETAADCKSLTGFVGFFDSERKPSSTAKTDWTVTQIDSMKAKLGSLFRGISQVNPPTKNNHQRAEITSPEKTEKS